MKIAYTNEQMRLFDAQTIESGVPSLVLMERAGEALADRVWEVMREKEIGDVLFVCGGGNNGGDGFVAARKLREAGCDVDVLCMAQRFSDDCAHQRELFDDDVLALLPRRRYALVVDCLFGTGLTREIEGESAILVDFINNSGAYVIACDIPSGLTECGVALAHCVRADETLTIGQLKQGLLLADGADYAGTVRVAEIGIAGDGSGAEVWEEGDLKRFFPKRKSHTSKGDYGAAAIIAGDAFSGAAFLAAGSCLKSGAGYTRLYVSDSLYPCAVGKLPSVVLQPFSYDETLLRCECIAIGMGMGVSEELYALLARLLKEYRGTLLIDADGLNALARYGVELLKQKTCRVVLTPHPKEFARLCGKNVAEVVNGGAREAQAFAEEYEVTLALKNNRTIVTDGQRVAILTAGSPCLAKGGSGDVLAGLLAGTIARGIACFDAACCASFLLGKAGEYAARAMGEYAPDAQDIVNFLPAVMKALSQ